ncbi:hypothetical protein BKA70DRAFT_1223657 [Coprinopsis sp. MPI-PUGE-AT-0042]|nr:hypothetical protein BKA70DRAFT_1223657 [Coprinopsis sp. MPI-PUGE-AT-0042]
MDMGATYQVSPPAAGVQPSPIGKSSAMPMTKRTRPSSELAGESLSQHSRKGHPDAWRVKRLGAALVAAVNETAETARAVKRILRLTEFRGYEASKGASSLSSDERWEREKPGIRAKEDRLKVGCLGTLGGNRQTRWGVPLIAIREGMSGTHVGMDGWMVDTATCIIDAISKTFASILVLSGKPRAFTSSTSLNTKKQPEYDVNHEPKCTTSDAGPTDAPSTSPLSNVPNPRLSKSAQAHDTSTNPRSPRILLLTPSKSPNSTRGQVVEECTSLGKGERLHLSFGNRAKVSVPERVARGSRRSCGTREWCLERRKRKTAQLDRPDPRDDIAFLGLIQGPSHTPRHAQRMYALRGSNG